MDEAFLDPEQEAIPEKKSNPKLGIRFLDIFDPPPLWTILPKGHITKVYSIGVCELQNCPRVISHRKIYPYSKKLGVLKTAKSSNFEIVNFIQIGRFLAILLRFSQKKT